MPKLAFQPSPQESPPSNSRKYIVPATFDTIPNPFQVSTSSYTSNSKNLFFNPANNSNPSDTTSKISDSSSRTSQRNNNSNIIPSLSSHSKSFNSQYHQETQRHKSISEQRKGYNDHDQDLVQGQEQEQENPLIYLTPGQREAAVENLEIETIDRIQKLRASIGVLTNSLRFRSEAEFNKLPAAIRTMTVEEFWFTYNGSAKEYLEQQNAKKTVANTSFLQALGIVNPKKKRDTIPQSDIHNMSRYKPYPSQGESRPHKLNNRPFVDARLGQNKNE